MSNLFTQQQQSFYSKDHNAISFFGPRTDAEPEKGVIRFAHSGSAGTDTNLKMLGDVLNEAKSKNNKKIKVPSADELPTLAGKIKDIGNAFQSVSSNSGQNNNLMQLAHSAEE